MWSSPSGDCAWPDDPHRALADTVERVRPCSAIAQDAVAPFPDSAHEGGADRDGGFPHPPRASMPAAAPFLARGAAASAPRAFPIHAHL